MFDALGSLVFRLRYLVIAIWVALAVGAMVLAPSLAVVGSADESSFLPKDAEAIQARTVLARAFPGESAPGTGALVLYRASGLTDADRAYLAQTATWLAGPDAPAATHVITSIVTAADHPELAASLRSSDGTVELAQVELSVAPFQTSSNDAVYALRDHVAATQPEGLHVYVTGSAGIGADFLDAIIRATGSTTIITVLLVIGILLLIYRAPLAALVPLLTIGSAFLVSRGALGYLAQGGLKISTLLDSFLVVLVFGIGTDYTIFLISRFREEVKRDDWHTASRTTVRRIGAVISASAATVIVGLGSMVVARFEMIQTTGPALALTVFITLLAGLTLAPALLGVFGHYLFWPRHQEDGSALSETGFWNRLARLITDRPGMVTIVIIAVMILPALAVPGLRSSFDLLGELPGDSDARQGFEVAGQHLNKGELFPVTVLVDTPAADLTTPASLAKVQAIAAQVATVPGIKTVRSVVDPQGTQQTPAEMRPSGQIAALSKQMQLPTDPSALASQLASPDTLAGFDAAGAYLAALGTAFPDVASGPAYTDVTRNLTALRSGVEELRAGARVSAQLTQLSTLLSSPPATPGASSAASTAALLQAIGGYLQELAAAYPEVTSTPAFGTATGALQQLRDKPDPATVGRLAGALRDLSTTFADRPDALLFPRSLPASAEATKLQEQLRQSLDGLRQAMDALAAQFSARPDDYFLPASLPGDAGSAAQQLLAAFVSADHRTTRLIATVNGDPYATTSFEAVRVARAAAAGEGSSFGDGARVLVGGPIAEFADIQTTIGEDFQRVALITVTGVLLVLILLLRSIVAPLFLVGSVLLSYATSLGLVTLLFQDVLGHAGVNYFIPLLVFVLLVAIGADYNIFLMSRIREESEGRGIRDGIRIASARTGTVITSAGIILAGTFLALISAPLQMLLQVGVAVAVGILVDTFIVRSLLVPAITAIFGDLSWWPSSRRPTDPGSGGAPDEGVRGVAATAWPIARPMSWRRPWTSTPETNRARSPAEPSPSGRSRRRLG